MRRELLLPGAFAVVVLAGVCGFAVYDFFFALPAHPVFLTLEVDAPDAATVDRTRRVIAKRLDEYGIPSRAVAAAGAQRIVVTLPDVDAVARLRPILETRGLLELRGAYYQPDGRGPFQGATRADVEAQVPPSDAAEVVEHRGVAGEPAYWMLLERTAVVTGEDVRTAAVGHEQTSQAVVEFELQPAAAERFADYTRGHIGRHVAIVLDGRLLTAPRINSEIGRRGMIEGKFTDDSAMALALQLRSGALPAPVRIVEVRDPTAGTAPGAAPAAPGAPPAAR